MNDVAALEFSWERAKPIPAERRTELLATPGFGDTYSDHMVTVQWTAEVLNRRAWSAARNRARCPFGRQNAFTPSKIVWP